MTDSTGPATIESLADPTDLRDDPDVLTTSREREFPREQYEALAERYDELDGVVQVGLLRSDGAALLQRHDESEQWHPPGGNVAQEQDWVVAARETIEALTGQQVAIDEAVLYGRQTFLPATDPEAAEPVLAETVVFGASLVEATDGFEEEPTLASELDHPLYGDGEEIGLELAWFESVPEAVDPNHREEIELLVG